MQAHPDLEIGVHVVWVPMLAGDSEAAARTIRAMFNDPRVRQYWDPNRLVGTTYAKHVFPTFWTDLQAALNANLPSDHWWHRPSKDRKNAETQLERLWDITFLYREGAAWDKQPPKPASMVTQVFFYGETENGPTGMFSREFAEAPVESDWTAELSRAMRMLIREEPPGSRG